MNVKEILKALSIDEKVKLLAGKNFWTLHGIERLAIPEIRITDGPHGVRLSDGFGFESIKPATAFPIEAAMASTFNETLIGKIGATIAEECHYYGVSVLLGPGVNGKRSPLGGRNFEYYSEDPYLSGKMASAFINGVQNEGIGTSLKHFAANDQETRRMTINAMVGERAFREIYLYPFEMAIKNAKPWTVMGAYNKVNGVHACQNKPLLLDILRDEFGYEGLTLSDWGGVVDKPLSVKCGLDLEMPGPGKRDDEVIEAFKSGELSLKALDARVENVLNLIKKAMDNKKGVGEIQWENHHELARDAAREAIVLLKNDECILPLDSDKSVAVIGQFAEKPRFQGGGSSIMNPHQLDVAIDCIKGYSDIVYARGYVEDHTTDEMIREAKQAAKGKDAVILFAGTTEKIESEGYDRRDMKIPADHIELIEAVASENDNIIVVLNSGSAVETRQFETQSKAILQAWLGGESAGCAIADVLFGKVSPSGKLSETFPVRLEHTPAYGSFPGFKDEVTYDEGLLVGYRYYDTKKLAVQYPFGHGLSYTAFEYSKLRLSSTHMTNGELLTVSVDVKNSGDCAGKEAVQVYVRDRESLLFRPEKELKGFDKVYLEPNETKTVTVTLDERAFAYYLPHLGRFEVESGTFDIMVGASSRDIRLTEVLTFESDVEVRPELGGDDSILEWLADDRYCHVIQQLLDLMGIHEGHPFYAIMVGLPVKNIFDYMEAGGAPKVMVDQLRKAVLGQKTVTLKALSIISGLIPRKK